ncbi:glycerol-3-phosphate 1-O-acyltransferase PlsY [Pontibacter sp. G13]|uniref:glycerol-3-phosphate 1-O-acyltransferase PlsY n=1 Tax=Pontibacter sp. G13 TaxID=3074898 RepID=UPI0028896888|nr:glycerol-3-phosphate 1-O-acyltransferase PlsY [Pontibacter sp. G13]WNJ18041.1 glycerol-3-phosphate 1-O-acyltransferase PlsY [Pontibacter sp. G13]
MVYLYILGLTIVAYLVGSLPVSIWLAKWYYGIDIRDHGSGRTTHTNVHRVLGLGSGLLVQGLDIAKGFLAAKLAWVIHLNSGVTVDLEYFTMMMVFGLAAILGHIYPLFAGFRGGKGFHVSLGVLIAVNPIFAAVVAVVSFVIYLLSQIPRLGFILGAVAVPVFVAVTGSIYGELRIPMMIFSVALALMLLISHRQNLQKIIEGKEAKVPINWPKLPPRF